MPLTMVIEAALSLGAAVMEVELAQTFLPLLWHVMAVLTAVSLHTSKYMGSYMHMHMHMIVCVQ